MITAVQRQQRRRFLGSSDSPIIMGLSPYKVTPGDVFWSKKAELPDESTESMDVGTWIEKPMLEWAAGELGVQITTKPKDLFHVAEQGEGADLLAANHDSLIVGQPASIEAKFANGEMAQAYGEPGSDQVAYHVLIQVEHQMYVSNLQKVYVALAVPSFYGIDRRLYCVPRDDELIRMIVDFGVRWWNEHVKVNVPPDGESTPPLYVLKVLERKAGAQIKLPDEAVTWADQRTQLKEQIKALEADVDDVSAKLIHTLGDAEIGLLTDGRKVTYQQAERNSLDAKRLRLERPEVAAEYTNTTSYRTLYIKKK